MEMATLLRVTLELRGHTWVYRFPLTEWKRAVARVVKDAKRGKIPKSAAPSLVAAIVGSVCDESSR